MSVMKLIHLAVWCQAASLCLATDEARHDSLSKEAGRAMMQLSGGPAKKSGPQDAPAQKSKPSSKSTKLSKKSNSTAKTPDASNVALSNSGYKTIATFCCNYEMEEYIRRIVMSENLKVCSEGGLEGTVPYYTCENAQNYSMLLAEVKASTSGTCPWTAPKSESCKKISKACSATSDPMSHRRRNCGRNDNSQNLDLGVFAIVLVADTTVYVFTGIVVVIFVAGVAQPRQAINVCTSITQASEKNNPSIVASSV